MSLSLKLSSFSRDSFKLHLLKVSCKHFRMGLYTFRYAAASPKPSPCYHNPSQYHRHTAGRIEVNIMSHRRQRVGVGVPLRPAAAADAEGKRVMLSAHDNPSNEQTNATPSECRCQLTGKTTTIHRPSAAAAAASAASAADAAAAAAPGI